MYVTPANFMYRSNFPTLLDQNIQNAITFIEASWSGIYSLWSSLDTTIRTKKITMLENLMVAWYLADINPKAVTGIVANGGLPLNSKSIGGVKGVSLTFRQLDVQPGMESFTSNTFGVQSLSMMMGAPERFGVYGRFGPGLPRGTSGGQGF
jgi:hypothetical protein